MQPLISVVIPTYNSNKTIARCLESVIRQTYENIEIIIVDDGSTDNTVKSCVNILKNYPKCSIIPSRHSGVSSARNRGIKVAKGHFLFFVDSDDELPNNAVEVLCNARHNGKLVMGNLIEREYVTASPRATKGDLTIIGRNDFLVALFDEKATRYFGYLCDKLYDLQLVKKYNIKFKEDVFVNEDRLFLLEYLTKIDQIVLVNDVVYYYDNPNSAATSQWVNRPVTIRELSTYRAYDYMAKISSVFPAEIQYLILRSRFESALDIHKRNLVNKNFSRRSTYYRVWKTVCPLLIDHGRASKMSRRVKDGIHALLGR